MITFRHGVRWSAAPTPRCWLILADMEYAPSGVRLGPYAPPSDEGTGERGIREIDRDRGVQHPCTPDHGIALRTEPSRPIAARTVGERCLSRYPARWCGNQEYTREGPVRRHTARRARSLSPTGDVTRYSLVRRTRGRSTRPLSIANSAQRQKSGDSVCTAPNTTPSERVYTPSRQPH